MRGSGNYSDWYLRQSEGPLRYLIFAVILVLTFTLACAHYRFGLSYEFHAFFGIPVLLSVWFIGAAVGYAVAIIAVALWVFVDITLLDGVDGVLIFNSITRLIIAIAEVWFLNILRTALQRERMLARTDNLTGLPNRFDFFERGDTSLAIARRHNEPFSVVFIDLDNFKKVNDDRGHDEGDRLLEQVGRVLRNEVRPQDVVGRIGGDEFALLLLNADHKQSLKVVNRLNALLDEQMTLYRWPVTFSIGIASYDRLNGDLDSVIKEADKLMYEVKKTGRNRVLQRKFLDS